MLRYEFDPPIEQPLSEDGALILRVEEARRTRGGRIKAAVYLLNGSTKFNDEIDLRNHVDRKRFYHGGAPGRKKTKHGREAPLWAVPRHVYMPGIPERRGRARPPCNHVLAPSLTGS